MHRTPLLALLFAAACAPTAPAGSASPSPTTRVVDMGGGAEVVIGTDVRAEGAQVAGTPDRVWNELVAVYQDMEIPLTTVDRASWRAGNAEFSVLRRLAGRPVTSYVRCGSTQSGPVAATNRVQMSVNSELTAVGSDSTRIRSWITASAHSTQGASRSPVACSTTGALEREIAERVARRLSGG